MSDETKADLETALHYFSIYPDNQPYHSTYGLLQTAIDDFTDVSGDDE